MPVLPWTVIFDCTDCEENKTVPSVFCLIWHLWVRFFFLLICFFLRIFFFFFIDSFLKTSSTKSSEIKWTHYACHSPIQAMQDCKGHFYCSVLKDKTQCLKLHRLNDTHVPLSPTPPVLHPLSPCINPCFFDLYPYKCRLRRSSLFFLFFFLTGLRTECLPAQVIIWTAG